MNRQAIIVVGAEGAGTRWVTGLCIAAGCHGSAEHHQPFDHTPPAGETPVVWRRSLPFGGPPGARVWPDLSRDLHDPLARAGYTVRVLAVVRDPLCTAASQLARNLARDESEAFRAIARANAMIGRFVEENALECRWVTYEGIVQRPEGFKRLLAAWGLKLEEMPAVVDGNAKYGG